MNNREFFEDIESIKKLGDFDPEGRHAWEDGVAQDFIREIAEAGGVYALRAKLLLEVLDEDVVRWYA